MNAASDAEEGAAGAAEWADAMRSGDFERAWTISDRSLARLRGSDHRKHEGPRHLQRIWRGEKLQNKKVLVRCYHGLGDTIQFIRFARPLHRIARQVVVWCQPELVGLVSRVDGVDLAIPLHDGTVGINFDVDIEIMEIPHAIRATAAEMAMEVPYLRLSKRVHRKLPDHGGDLSVGVVWQTGGWIKQRSIPPHLLKRLRRAGVQLYSLQLGEAEVAASIGAIDISSPEIETLGTRLCALDLIVCPDTMVAHLSAALGCETWILLHLDCDWRWPNTGGTTPWYPSARLFRQHAAGDWRGVVDDIEGLIVSRLERRRTTLGERGSTAALPH